MAADKSGKAVTLGMLQQALERLNKSIDSAVTEKVDDALSEGTYDMATDAEFDAMMSEVFGDDSNNADNNSEETDGTST